MPVIKAGPRARVAPDKKNEKKKPALSRRYSVGKFNLYITRLTFDFLLHQKDCRSHDGRPQAVFVAYGRLRNISGAYF